MPGKGRMMNASRFAMVSRADVPRSAFDVSFTHKTTFDAGYLVPLYVEEVLPGDSMKVSMTAFARLATPIVPIMDNIYLESFFFFVPSRLVWDNWARFMGEQLNPADSTEFLVPRVTISSPTNIGPGSLADYFGIRFADNEVDPRSVEVIALPFRAYNLIFDQFFRDENHGAAVYRVTDDGPDIAANYFPFRRFKRADYFSTALPWPQKPTPITNMSLTEPQRPGLNMTFPASGAPVSGFGVNTGTAAGGAATLWSSGGRTEAPGASHDSNAVNFRMAAEVGGHPNIRVLINDIRTAAMVQQLLERNARGGTRYAELVFDRFGVRSQDARLQRPEYLGGGRAMVNVNPVAQTSATGATGTTTVLGELGGIGTALASGHGFSQSFSEHGYIIGMISARADMTYQQGINRMWFRRSMFEFYTPDLAHLGEQAILSRELYCSGKGAGGGDEDVFGFQERWSEYKYKPSIVSGLFRSSAAFTNLDYWHVGQYFGSRPVLNEAFLQESPPIDRVLQVVTTESQQFLVDAQFSCRYVRAMPMHSIPGMGVRL